MRHLHDDSGLSLTELLISCVLMGFIITISYMLLNTFSTSSDTSQAQSAASSPAQLAVDSISRNLMQAQPNDANDASGTFSVAQPSYAQFFVDINHDGKPDRVTYYVSGQVLYEVTASAVGSAAPYSFGSTSSPVPVLANLAATSTPVFTYYSSVVATGAAGPSGYAFQTVSTANPQLYATKISLVGVTLVNWATVGSKTATVTTTEMVRIRSVNSGVGS
jgi:Tfp pilus assembly protein PilV